MLSGLEIITARMKVGRLYVDSEGHHYLRYHQDSWVVKTIDGYYYSLFFISISETGEIIPGFYPHDARIEAVWKPVRLEHQTRLQTMLTAVYQRAQRTEGEATMTTDTASVKQTSIEESASSTLLRTSRARLFGSAAYLAHLAYEAAGTIAAHAAASSASITPPATTRKN